MQCLYSTIKEALTSGKKDDDRAALIVFCHYYDTFKK
jgi:hypothetical protein